MLLSYYKPGRLIVRDELCSNEHYVMNWGAVLTTQGRTCSPEKIYTKSPVHLNVVFSAGKSDTKSFEYFIFN